MLYAPGLMLLGIHWNKGLLIDSSLGVPVDWRAGVGIWKGMKQPNSSLSFSIGSYQSTTMATHFFFLSGIKLVLRDGLYISTLWEYGFLFLGFVVRYSFLFIEKC